MYRVPPKTVDTSQYPLSFICSHINLLSDAWHCQTCSYLTVSTLDPSPSTSHSFHTFIYFRSLLKCHFLRRPFLTTLFKFKILPYALLALLLPLLLALLLSGTLCCGCSPFTLRVPLPPFVPFSCLGKLSCMDYIHWAPLHSGFLLNFASGRHQQGLEGEGREGAFIPSASIPAGPRIGKWLLSTSKATPPVGHPSTSTALGMIWDTAPSLGGGSFLLFVVPGEFLLSFS